jgi:acetyl-CoA carboxylase carboxyl transferase subunit alpha
LAEIMNLVKANQHSEWAMERVRLARHDRRPYALDFISRIFTDFCEIHGDRKFHDDPALICGLAKFQGCPVVVIAHQKGRDVRERKDRNFGMPKPEGYRKALRVMKIAEKFGRPIITLIDTPGAYPGIDAEERGQAEAIAFNLREMARLKVPVIVTITGEGGSGGALAIGVGDAINILENGIYSVISPEGCAAILWKDSTKASEAADSLKLTAPELLELGIVDRIVPEPEGGAQNDWDVAAGFLAEALKDSLEEVCLLTEDKRIGRRYERFRRMGRLNDS